MSLQHDADEHQDDGVAEGVARGDARGHPPARPPDRKADMASRCTTGPARPMRGACSSRSSTRRCPTSARCCRSRPATRASPSSWRSTRGIACRSIVDGDFVLYESNAIVEYLDEAYPARGAPLFPGDARNRALVRRLIVRGRQLLRQGHRPGHRRGVLEEARRARCRPSSRRRRRRCARSIALFTRCDARRLPRGTAVGRRLRALSAGGVPRSLRDQAAGLRSAKRC